MKLSHKVDLTAKKAAAAHEIGALFEKKAREIDPTPTLHAAKLHAATCIRTATALAGNFPALMSEAADRGINIEELCSRIFDKGSATLEAIVELDGQRQQISRVLAAQNSEQDIIAVLRLAKKEFA